MLDGALRGYKDLRGEADCIVVDRVIYGCFGEDGWLKFSIVNMDLKRQLVGHYGEIPVYYIGNREKPTIGIGLLK